LVGTALHFFVGKYSSSPADSSIGWHSMNREKPIFRFPKPAEKAESDAAMTFELTQAPRRKLAETVTEKLVQAIRPLQPGTQLPSTQELTKLLGVGRSTVREALNALATLGIVEIRHGMGVVVAERPALDDGSETITVALAKGVTRDLLEARQIVEVATARLAAQRRTDTDLRDIEVLLESHANCVDYPIKPASEFHVLIAEASHHEVLVGVFRSFLKPMVTRGPRLYDLLDGFGKWELEQHRWIFEAIQAANPEEAAERMHHHVMAMEENYRKVGAV
jgi:GntR family transcriptional regulator, transcriptional repressor for pyruvate dehydrogenase complex